MLLGAGFSGWDFPHYALGSLIGWWIIYQIGRISIFGVADLKYPTRRQRETKK